jgi:hypothetical protein
VIEFPCVFADLWLGNAHFFVYPHHGLNCSFHVLVFQIGDNIIGLRSRLAELEVDNQWY